MAVWLTVLSDVVLVGLGSLEVDGVSRGMVKQEGGV